MKHLLFLCLMLLPALSFSQSISQRSDLDDRFWTLENEVRTYLINSRHSIDAVAMSLKGRRVAKEASILQSRVVDGYDLSHKLQRRIHRDRSFMDMKGSLFLDTALESRGRRILKMAEEQAKEHPYWLWTLTEIQRCMKEIGKSKDLGDIQRLNQKLSTIVPLD